MGAPIAAELVGPAKAQQDALASQIANIEVSTFETLDASVGLIVTDMGGRVMYQLPDPATAANAQALAGLQASATGADVFETLNPAGSLWLLDAGQRVMAQLADATAVAQQGAAIAALQAAGIGIDTFETLSLMVTDAGNRVIQAIYATDPALAAAVSANTANLATIADRIVTIVTAEGAPILNPCGRDSLRLTHMKLTKLDPAVAEAAQLVIDLGGDSYTHNASRWSGPATAKLVAKYGDAGGGWCGFGFLPSGNVAPWTLANQPSYTNGNVRPATYPTRHIGSAAGTYYTAASPDLARATLSPGDIICQAFPGLPVHNGCDLFFEGSADGVISYAWGTYNGSGSVADMANYTFGSATNINVQGPLGASQIADIKAGLPSGAGMLKITCVSGTPLLNGVNLKSAASGVRVNKLAATGSSISSWANAPATQFEAAISALGADLFVYMDGTNSQTGGIARGTWGNYLATVVARRLAARPSTDVLTATPPENQRTTNAISMAQYALENRYRAMVGGWCAMDMQPLFGSATNAAEYGSAGTIPLFNADLIHPEPTTGGRLLLVGMLNPIIPFRGA